MFGRAAAAMLGTAALLLTGCGPTLGAWLYHLGLVPNEKSKSEYTLPKGPILVLVDDDQDLVQPPTARQILVDELATQLRDHKLADRVTTNEEIARLRRDEPKFDQRGAREVGRMAGADTVIWLSVQQFALDSNLDLMATPATFAATLKIVNAKADRREDVRLWPRDREGRLMVATVTPQELRTCKSKTEVYQKMSAAMADKVAKLFYDYEIQK